MPTFFGKNVFIATFIFLLILSAHFFVSPPENFPVKTVISIEDGSSLRHISKILKEDRVIRSRVAFESFAITYGGEHHMVPGDYYFENSIPVFEVARRVARGSYGLDLVKLTIPEGFTVADIADLSVAKLRHFDKDEFLSLAKEKEGYLFPDTYFFFPIANAKDVLKNLSDNFIKKIKPLEQEIADSGRSESDIIIMASIIEREAKGDADRAIISGILWNRIKKGMPLQADAAPETYKTKGLPQNPICNPGLEAITAAIHPATADYFFYLHDKNGMIHYARTFSEHRANIAKYLK